MGQQGLQDWHKERLEILAGADGVDLVMFETIPCLAEARAVLSLLVVRGEGEGGREIFVVLASDTCCLSPRVAHAIDMPPDLIGDVARFTDCTWFFDVTRQHGRSHSTAVCVCM